MVVITVYVDDISGEMTVPDDHIVKELGDCISEISLALEDNRQELSKTKCACNASTDKLGRALEERCPPLDTY